MARIASGAVSLPRLRKTAVPGHPLDRVAARRGARRRTRAASPRRARGARVTSARPRCQVVSTVNAVTPISSGSQAPWTSLVRFAARNSRSTVSRNAAAGATSHSGFLHWWRDDVEEQQRGDRDRAGDRHAERERERGRGLEREHEREHRDHQQPVDPRHVDLPDRLARTCARSAAAGDSRAGRPGGRPRRRR